MIINFEKNLNNVKKLKPLIHNITNYVTVNDCANILLACGASPIMSDAEEEVEEITSICNGLNINIGTLNKNTIPSMFLACRKSNELKHPVLLDPVGAGASKLRTETALKLIKEVKFNIIRGNMSEIKSLATGTGTTRGVDTDVSDVITESTKNKAIELAKIFSRKTGAVIIITGAIDIVADSEKSVCIYNGHPMMSSITGTGCQLSAMTTAYASANTDNIFEAACSAVCAMGICGEIAEKRMTPSDGNSSYRNYIIDAVYNLNAETLQKEAKYETR